MPKFEIFAGLGGGFGGAQSYGIYECANAKEAERMAYDFAWEEYESYGGCHGLDDADAVRQDLADSWYDGDTEAVSEDEANQAYVEQVEGWIVWEVKLIEETITDPNGYEDGCYNDDGVDCYCDD